MRRATEIAGLIIVLLFVAAGIAVQQSVRQSEIAQATAAVAPPTATPLPIGPLVVSTNPDVIIEAWRYLGPNNPATWEELGFSRYPLEPGAIHFEGETDEAYARWREDGVDLIWWDFPCSTQPVVVIEGTTVGLWTNDHIFELCVAEAAPHAFRITLDSQIPREAWRYDQHDGMEIPPITLQTLP